MDNELLIVKAAGGELNFQHFFDVIGQLHASKFSITIFNGIFQIKLPNGERIQGVNWDDITIRDDSTGGTIYNPTSVEQLVTILVTLKYTAYYTVTINSGGGQVYIENSDSVTYTGSGTVDDPFIFTSTGGAGGTVSRIITTLGSAGVVNVSDSSKIFEVINMLEQSTLVTWTITDATHITLDQTFTDGDTIKLYSN